MPSVEFNRIIKSQSVRSYVTATSGLDLCTVYPFVSREIGKSFFFNDNLELLFLLQALILSRD